jgi:hypothetical protein
MLLSATGLACELQGMLLAWWMGSLRKTVWAAGGAC